MEINMEYDGIDLNSQNFQKSVFSDASTHDVPFLRRLQGMGVLGGRFRSIHKGTGIQLVPAGSNVDLWVCLKIGNTPKPNG